VSTTDTTDLGVERGRPLLLVGTRPEGIKMAPVVRELARRGEAFVLCTTGQHRELLEPILELFGMEPDIRLNVMREGQSLAQLHARLLIEIDAVVERVRPGWIVAQGDTTTVLAGATVAFYRGIRFGHVEAGLRSGSLAAPFPEEMNRRVADLTAARHWAPTEGAREALLREGVAAESIEVTGNTVIDALKLAAAMPFDWDASPLGALREFPGRLVLITAHRRENFGEPLRELCRAIRDLAERFGDTIFLFPLHPNPQVREDVDPILGDVKNVARLMPLDYLSMVQLLQRVRLVMTDSGGLQEEAPTFGTPVLVLRETTERPEGVAAGVARLVGHDRESIVKHATELMLDDEAYAGMARAMSPYGDGNAAKRIVDSMLRDEAQLRHAEDGAH
jgi:UDP-N-acetylglucosamine 2-epimerase (non-hydrolysing)